jgi:hypothetical protein
MASGPLIDLTRVYRALEAWARASVELLQQATVASEPLVTVHRIPVRMPRPGEQGRGRDNSARRPHRDPLGAPRDDPEVATHQQHRHAHVPQLIK